MRALRPLPGMSRGARGEGAAASGTNGGTADARTRAKVWSMENGQWVDRGTGHCTCERAASGEVRGPGVCPCVCRRHSGTAAHGTHG